MAKIRISKSTVDGIPFTEKGQEVYLDTDLNGFLMIVGRRTKTYAAQIRVNGIRTRVTIGHHGAITPDQARYQARTIISGINEGIDPFQKQDEAVAKEITVSQALEEYLADKRSLRPVTAKGYRYTLYKYAPDWAHRPLSTITKREIMDKQVKLGQSSQSTANKLMRVMRLLFNYVDAKYDGSIGNPCRYLSVIDGWYKEERRQTVIKQSDLEKWHRSVLRISNPHMRDYLLLLLFTGLRKTEAASMKWDDVDFENRTFTVRETKNHRDHTLPMSGWLFDFFQQRRIICGSHEYVFPGKGGKGRITTPRKSIDFVIRDSGVTFGCHDLRRTFATIAESLGLSTHMIKRLMNHKSSDVTSGYIVISIDDVRDPMERISQKISDLIANHTD